MWRSVFTFRRQKGSASTSLGNTALNDLVSNIWQQILSVTPVETYLTKVTLLTQELVKQDLKSVPVKQNQMNGEQNSLLSHAQHTGRPHFPSANYCQGQLHTPQSLSAVTPRLHGSLTTLAPLRHASILAPTHLQRSDISLQISQPFVAIPALLQFLISFKQFSYPG